MMMQDELVLVFQNACLETQLNRHTRFAFTDPFGVGFKNGEYFFRVGNDFSFEHAACDLIDLAASMLAITFDFKLQESLGGSGGDQLGQGGLNLVQMPLCLFDGLE